jgi:hypothetical protein
VTITRYEYLNEEKNERSGDLGQCSPDRKSSPPMGNRWLATGWKVSPGPIRRPSTGRGYRRRRPPLLPLCLVCVGLFVGEREKSGRSVEGLVAGLGLTLK